MIISEKLNPTSGDMAQNKPDRRRFFRVDDEIVLIYKQIQTDEIPDAESFKDKILDSFSLSAALEYLTQESHSQLKKIDRTQPDVARALKTIEQKISLITQALLSKEMNLADHPTRKVNISAAGMAFNVADSLEPGSVLELKLILPPSLTAVMTFGKVVYCVPATDDDDFPHHIGVDFLSLRDQDRDFLARYIVKKQLHQLKNRKKTD